MFRRYHHGHSVALGFVLALALERHTLTLVLLAAVLGVIVGRAWATWVLWASALREKWHLSRAEKVATTPQPVYPTSRKGRDDIPF